MPQDKKILNQLLLAKKMSDKEDYVAKYNIMQKLLQERPDEFYVDQDHPEYPGIVHAPTGFRMHLPRQATYGIEKKSFSPDLTAEEMQEAVDSIYDHKAPRLASMKAWPQEWLDDQDKMGWLEWYKNYSEGRRSDTDERQIKRWNSFKARHGSQFLANPTPRRAYALRNWAIDPIEMLPEDQRESFQKLMEAYKAKEYKKWDKKKAKEEDMEKASALGYKALTGNLGSLKQIIKHLRGQGYGGMGGRVYDPKLGRFKHTPISRVIPSNPKAQLPNTQHLPIGESKAFFNSGNARSLVVGKGAPRMNLDIKDKNLVGYISGVPGGTNPSPISSLLHEAGHLEHARMVKQLANNNSKVFGSNLPYSLKDYGIHGISSGKYNPLTLLDEVGANNSALQLLKQTGATPQAQAFYKGVRYPSFKTHLDKAISDQTTSGSSLINKITKEAPHGFTQDYSGINRFYDV